MFRTKLLIDMYAILKRQIVSNPRWRLLVLLALVGGAGCRPEPMGGPRAQTIPVTGKVYIDGKPQTGLSVTLIPMDRGAHDAVATSSGKPVPTSNAWVANDGTFKVGTYVQGDGAPPGDYVLTVQWGTVDPFTNQISGDKFRGKYNDAAKSEIKVSVPESAKEVDCGTIDLKSK